MIWQVPRMWEGGDVWIIGGGPSVPKQFSVPEKVIQKVVEGTSPPSAYSKYMSLLHNKHTIGINVAYLLGDWIDMVFFGDKGFYLKHEQNLSNFPGLIVSCHPEADKIDWVKYTPRDTSRVKGISQDPRKVSWNNNSGSAAISVAVHAGAKRIILLGFDMKLNGNHNQHWHDVYHKGQIVGQKSVRGMSQTFDRHLRSFPEIAKDAKRLGVEILNASPDSAIECFPKFSVKELLLDNS